MKDVSLVLTSKDWKDFLDWCSERGFQPSQFLLDYYVRRYCDE